MQFSATVNRFIVKTLLNSAFTNDLKRKEIFSKNVHSCRLRLFKTPVLGAQKNGLIEMVLLSIHNILNT